MKRPDLSQLPSEIIAYIEYLESKIKPTGEHIASEPQSSIAEAGVLADEPPTTICVVTISQERVTKRTFRHLYSRQHRGGMGIFDLDVAEPDFPAILTSLDKDSTLTLLTNKARLFRKPVAGIAEAPVRDRGQVLQFDLPFERGEKLVSALQIQSTGSIALVSASGMARVLPVHVFGETTPQGRAMYALPEFGDLAAACWTPDDADLFIATRRGKAIRFSRRLIPPKGAPAIRLTDDDAVVAVTPVYEDSGVFLAGSDGKGTTRLMSGFAANKSAGGGGKLAFKNEEVIGALTVSEEDDLFIISQLGKIIRFPAGEVATTEGVVQGVNCINLRRDQAVAVTR